MLKVYPNLSKTLSAKNSKKFIRVMDLNGWSKIPLEDRFTVLENIVRNMYATLEVLGMYEDLIYRNYVRSRTQIKNLKKKLKIKTKTD